MADLEAFEKIEDIDPAADFIAREQSALAEISNDMELKSDLNHVNSVNGEIGDDIGSGGSGDTEGTDMINNVSNSVSANNLTNSSQVNGGDKEPVKEPEKIRKWREEQQTMLKQKDEEEVKKRKELGEQAKKELDEWYARYEEQLNKSKATNR